MALRNYQNAQQDLKRSPVYTYKPNIHDVSPDIKEFLIEKIDPQNGSVGETLSLQGTHLPHQPFTHSVSQQIYKYYYPGGQAQRTPTVQVMGSEDQDITLRGQLRATKIRDADRRTEPLTIAKILERFVREGNVCRFHIGDWIKYGIIIEFMPEYHNDSWIDYTIRLMVIGDKNPITGEESTGDDNPIARVFSTDQAEDFTQTAQEIANDLLETKNDLEESGYLPKINVVPFSISEYLSRLTEGTAVGDVVDFGEVVFEEWKNLVNTVDTATSSAVNFSENIERTVEDIVATFELLKSQISKTYKIQENLFSAVSRIGTTYSTFERLASWNTLGNMIDYTTKLQGHIKDMERAVQREEILNFKEVYFSKPGDTLQSISTRFFGNTDRWEEIGLINNIGVGETLREDTLLIIPN